MESAETSNTIEAMTYDPIIAFARQRIADLGGALIAGQTPSPSLRSGLAESDKRAVLELQLIITLCEGLNKQQDYLESALNENKFITATQASKSS